MGYLSDSAWPNVQEYKYFKISQPGRYHPHFYLPELVSGLRTIKYYLPFHSSDVIIELVSSPIHNPTPHPTHISDSFAIRCPHHLWSSLPYPFLRSPPPLYRSAPQLSLNLSESVRCFHGMPWNLDQENRYVPAKLLYIWILTLNFI